MRTILLAAVLAGQVGGADAPPLKAVRSWNMEYGDSMCVAARAYGDPVAPITIAFKPTPFGDMLQGVVLGPKKQLGRQARVKIDLMVSGRELGEQQNGMRVHFPDEDRAAITFYFSREEFESLVGAPTFTVRASGSPTISVALSMGKPVLAALRTCETDLLQHFGYDPAKIAMIAKQAEGASPAQWITNDDYPPSVLNEHKQGVSFIGWTISPVGRISDCRILRSSGTPALDKAACDAIQKRGRYRPALDAAGKPVESYSTRQIRWQLPG